MSRGREGVARAESRRRRANPKTTRRVTVFRFSSQHRTGLLGTRSAGSIVAEEKEDARRPSHHPCACSRSS
jgi:hypothetical protein